MASADTALSGGDTVEARPGLAAPGLPAGTTTLFVLLIAAVLATSSPVFYTLNFAMPVRWDAAVWMVLGIGVLFGLAGVLYWLHPWWIRRKHRLRELTAVTSPQLVGELHELCRLAGVSPPKFMLAPYAVRTVDGLAFGHVRHRSVKLDMGLVALRDGSPAGFRAVVLHELAHLHNRDVDLTYFTVAIWRSFVVVAVPLMLTLSIRSAVRGPTSNWSLTLMVVASLLVLTLLVYLTRNALLRARELYADARVMEWDSTIAGAALRGIFGREANSSPRDTLVRRARDDHPHPQQRVDTLDDPDLLSRPRMWELFAVGMVAAVLLANGFVFWGHLLTQFTHFSDSPLVLPVVTGAVAALVLAVVRAMVLARAGRPGHPLRMFAFPLVLTAGFLVGEATSLINTAGGRWFLFAQHDRNWPEGATVLTAVISLVVGGLLLTAWAKSAIAGTLDVLGRVNRGTRILATRVGNFAGAQLVIIGPCAWRGIEGAENAWVVRASINRSLWM